MYSIKAILTTAPIVYYKNTQDGKADLVCTNIVLSNTSAVVANVYVSFTRKDADFNKGSILYKYSLPANSSINLNERRINPDQTIQAYCDTADVVALSIDIIGDFGEYIEPV